MRDQRRGLRLGRTLLAILLAPLLSPVIFQFQGRDLDLRVVGLVLTVAYFGLIAFGLPVFFVFYRIGWREWWQFAGAGAIACCAFLVFDIVDSSRRIDWGLLAWAGRFGIHAVVAALVFWLIAIRPFRAAASNAPAQQSLTPGG